MADRKAKPLLPPDAAAHVNTLPPWLRDVAASAFAATADPAGVAKLEREQSDLKHQTRHAELVAQIQFVQRGGLGRRKEAAECIAAIDRVLAGAEPRKAEMASLVLCESIIREAKQRIRNSKRPAPSGRGAP